MNVFDQSARYVAKSDPAGFLRWLVPGLPPALMFRGWLDARTLPFPGDPDRTCDTVAELVDPSGRWALAIEFQSEPDAQILDRLLEYLARLRRELGPGPRRRDRFRVAAGLVQLTGPRPADTLDMTLPGDPPVGLRLTIACRALRDEDAASALAEIEAGRVGRWLLAWIPLMKGGGKPTMVEAWKSLARADPDTRSRANHAVLALIFAGLTGHLDRWKKALEGWNVKESTVVNEWKAEWMAEWMAEWKPEWTAEGKAEGKAEGRREALVEFLRLRFPGEVPGDLLAAIEAESDLGRLARGVAGAAKAASIGEFRALSGF